MVFDSYKRGNDDTGRLFVCFRHDDGIWSKAIDLGDEINFAPVVCALLSPDMKYLFYACNEDIYWVDAKIIKELISEVFK